MTIYQYDNLTMKDVVRFIDDGKIEFLCIPKNNCEHADIDYTDSVSVLYICIDGLVLEMAKPQEGGMAKDDLISRQVAINAMSANNLNRNLDSASDDDIARMARAAQRVIAGIPSAQQWMILYT